MATDAIKRAQQLEADGQLVKAEQCYMLALADYEAHMNKMGDVVGKFYIVEQCKLIMTHVERLRAMIEESGVLEEQPPLYEENTNTASSTSPSASAKTYQQQQADIARHIANLPSVPKQPAQQHQQQHTSSAASTASTEEERMRSEILALCMKPEEMPDVSWDDVIGMETVKRFFDMAVAVPQKLSHIYKANRVVPTVLLMYGPPGVGKTFVVKALAKKCGRTFLPVSCASIISKYVGDSAKYVKVMMEVAKSLKPCILFIDEFDALTPDRDTSNTSSSNGGDSSKTVAELLQQLDGITRHDMSGVLMIGATNLPWDIGDSVRRRCSRMIYIPLPAEEDRYQLIAHRLGQNSDDVGHCITEAEVRQLARETAGYSNSDLVKLIVTAYESTIEDIARATHFRIAREQATGTRVMVPCEAWVEGAHQISLSEMSDEDAKSLRPNAVTYEYLRQTMQRIKPSVDAGKLVLYDDFTAKYGEAS
jgi:vacuolar protein-sorting-associated protein 4